MEELDVDIKNLLYDAKLECPVCNREILFRTVKSGKLRLIKTDLDLKPTHDLLDPSMYEVVTCNICGFACLRKSLKLMTDKKIDLIKDNISKKFVERTYPDVYDSEIAIERFKLALLNAMVIGSKESEKAYICLKIAWLYRGWIEKEPNLDKEEELFLGFALKGFKEAYHKENFPTMGLDELTIKFLIGELSRRLGHYEEASRWLSEVLVSRNASKRLKERAIESKDLLRSEKKLNQKVEEDFNE